MSARAWLRHQGMRALARLARRPYRVRRGRERVSISSLASPLRYDIVVRRDFLAELRARLDAPLPELVTWARGTSYWVWFRDVRWQRASPRFRARQPDVAAAFAERVRGAISLSRSFARRGFDPRFPITLKSADRFLPTEGGKKVEGRFVAGGGCHRIALLWLGGARELEPDQYVIHHFRELTPLDNTRLLRTLLRERPEDYVRFVASAYRPTATADVRELVRGVSENAPERLENLTTLLRSDGIVELPDVLRR